MNDSAKRFHRIELISVILCLFFVLVGITEEVIAYYKMNIIVIEDFRNFSMVILQIQAGVSTITVALIALISGMINEEVYGISITRYYMITRPRFFKQIAVVISTISLVFVGIIFAIFELYNMVCSCFFIEWILIIISVIEIFPVFYGRKKCEIEIRDYVESAMSSSDIKVKMEMNTIFLESWLSDICNNDFKDREKLLLLGVENMLLDNSDEAIGYVNEKVEELIRAHLTHNEHWIIGRGLQLLQSVYKHIWMMLLNEIVDTCSTTSYPAVIHNLYYDIRSALLHLDIKEIEDYLDFHSLSEYSAIVAVYYLEYDQELCMRVLSTLETYASFLGFVFGLKQGENHRELDDIDISYWSRMLESIFISESKIPEKMLPVFKLHRCKLYFSYISSLIQDGNTNLLIKYFYGSNQYIYTYDLYNDVLRLSVQCYLYYLAEAESVNIVPEKAQKSAQYILSQKEEVTYPFEKFLERICGYNMKLFVENDFEKLIGDVLDRFEMYNMGQVKHLIMSDTIRLWYVSLILFVHRRYVFGGSITDYLHGDILSYVIMFLRDNADNAADRIVRIYELLSYNKVNNLEDKKSELYGKLKRALIEKYKTVDINESYESHKKFIDEDKETFIIENAKESILKELKDTFAPVIDESIRQANEIRFVLIQLHNETRFLNEKTVLGIMGYIEENFCANLISHLYHAGKVEIYNHSGKSDEEYIEYLKKNNASILMGSEYELGQMDYTKKKMFDEFEQTCDCIYTSGRNAIALEKDKLKISINNVNVSIHSGDLNEDSISFDEASGKYRIKFFDDVEGMFDKQEAIEYSKNKFKIISVSVKVAIQAEDRVGVIIQSY